MKKLLFTLVFSLLATSSLAQEWQEARMNLGIVGGGVAAATEPPAGTVLFGVTGTPSEESAADMSAGRLYFSPYAPTATWAESSSTTTLGSVKIYVRQNSTCNNSHAKVLIYNGGELIANGTSDIKNLVNGGAAKDWLEFTYTTEPTITKGQTYQIGIITDDTEVLRYYWDGVTDNDESVDYVTTTYASPATSLASYTNLYPATTAEPYTWRAIQGVK